MPAPFDAYLTRRLRALGLRGGRAVVAVHDGALELRGDEAGVVRVARDDVARVRVGYVDATGRIYETRLWRAGEATPLTLIPYREAWPAYAGAVRALVAASTAGGRTGRVERGLSRGAALLVPLALAPVALGAAAVALLALGHAPWWGRLLVPALPTALVALTLWLGLTRHWPRPVASAAELDAQLPR